MGNGKIFLVGDSDSNLVEMKEQRYEKEDHLQALVAKYPDLLPGDQIDPEEPCRWLLVAREMGIPDREGGGDRWSIDHLFVDHTGIPTFVECKRSSDPRGRREVVAQMLDYAANGSEYWAAGRLRQAAAATPRAKGVSVDDEIRKLIGCQSDEEIAAFWTRVEKNLKEGQVRLIFVADEIPRELRRLVEFLNEQMTKVEVLAVEVKQFIHETRQALVPRVIGASESARATKTRDSVRAVYSSATFLEACAPEARPFVEKILALAEKHSMIINYGTARFSIRARRSGSDAVTFAMAYPSGDFEFYLDAKLALTKEANEEVRREILAVPGFKSAGEYTLRTKVDAANREKVLAVFTKMMDRAGVTRSP
jgi:hypothetical protein